MIIFQQSGRLGNQLFQYAALKTLCQGNCNLVLLGFEELQTAFEGVEAKIINVHTSRLERGLYYRFYRMSDFLSQKKILTRINESPELSKIIYNFGLFKKIAFVEESFFQSESFFNVKVLTSLNLKPELLNSAQQLLNTIIQKRVPIFVHIRRGDYMNWPSKEYPAILKAKYYQKCIDIFQSKIKNCFFIFTSDDPFYVEEFFSNIPNSYIAKGSQFEDFSLMTLCKGGILSASSFSWWAAYFSKQKAENAFFLAPKYWGGHRIQSWIPQSIESSFLTYI